MPTLNIEIEPQSYKRARLSTYGGKSHVHNEKDYLKYRNSLAFLISWQLKERKIAPLLDKPIKISCEFYLTPPKSMIKKTSEPWKNQLHVTTPDIDNLAKALLDSCNKILFNDDSQVVELNIKKAYDVKPHIIINFEYLNGTV